MAADDYSENTPVALEFLECVNTKQCHYIDLVEDNILEINERFNVAIEASPQDKNKIDLVQANAQVEILDNMSRKYVSL